MDILCTRCGEPWDVCSLTDDMTSGEAKYLKAGRGCPCCINKPDSEVTNRAPDASLAQRAIADVLGDDIDGLAATVDDFNLI